MSSTSETAVTGKELREWRERLGIPRGIAAAVVSVGTVTLDRYESGRVTLPAELATRLAGVYRRNELFREATNMGPGVPVPAPDP